MLKPAEIKVVTANEPGELQTQLNRLLSAREPWTLHGDLKVVWGANQFTYMQAVVRLEPMEIPGMSQLQPAGGIPLIMPRG